MLLAEATDAGGVLPGRRLAGYSLKTVSVANSGVRSIVRAPIAAMARRTPLRHNHWKYDVKSSSFEGARRSVNAWTRLVRRY